MDRTAILIDVGYLYAGGSLVLTGQNLKRGELHLDQQKFLEHVSARAEKLTRLPLLRIYWYDGTSGAATAVQQAMAYRPFVKLRLGFVNRQGEQKGVDSLIVTDLINLSRNRAAASIVLMTGDEDIRVGVQQAQEHGVHVHLLGITPTRDSGVSGFLRQEVDTFELLTKEEVASFLRAEPKEPGEPVPPQPAAAPAGVAATGDNIADRITAIVATLLEQIPESDIALVAQAPPTAIPGHVDRQLLAVGVKLLGENQLAPATRKQLRQALVDACREQSGL